MKIKSFLRLLYPETCVRIEHVDGRELAFGKASDVKNKVPQDLVVVREYPECSPLTCGYLAITVKVQDGEQQQERISGGSANEM